MKRLRMPLYLLTALCLLLVTAGPGVALVAAAAEDTGSLAIQLVDQDGSALPGGCFRVTDADHQRLSACGDDDGVAYLDGLAAGSARVVQTSTPDNARGRARATVEITAGETTMVTLVNEVSAPAVVDPPPAMDDGAPIGQEPTEDVPPTAVPSEDDAGTDPTATPRGRARATDSGDDDATSVSDARQEEGDFQAAAESPRCDPRPAADLSNCHYDGEDLSGANFSGSNLTGSTFDGATLTNADFSGVTGANTTFNGADADGANFSGGTSPAPPSTVPPLCAPTLPTPI